MTIAMVDEQVIEQLHAEGIKAAKAATQAYLDRHGDSPCCGFAWTTIYDVKLSTRLGRKLKSLGFRKGYHGGIELWNPSGNPTQSIDAKEAGAQAYADVMKNAGLCCYVGSRLD